MKKRHITPLQICIFVGIVFVFLVIGSFFFLQVLAGTWYGRITSGPFYDRYMGKRFEVVNARDGVMSEQREKMATMSCLINLGKTFGYTFTPLSLVSISATSKVDDSCIAVFKGPKIYEVIDL